MQKLIQNVLIGVPEEFTQANKNKLTKLLNRVLENEANYCFAYSINDFITLLKNPYELIICVDDIGMGTEYVTSVIDEGVCQKCIVIVPENKKESPFLHFLIEENITNIVFQNDLSVDLLKSLIGHDRDIEQAYTYCGFNLRPVSMGSVSDEVTEQPYFIRKQIADGIYSLEIHGRDFKRYQGEQKKDTEESRFCGTVLRGDDVDGRQMLYQDFPIDEEWVQSLKNKLRMYFRKAGSMAFQSFDNGDMSRDRFESLIYAELKKYGASDEHSKIVCDSFMRDVLSYGKLDALITNPLVSDVRLVKRDVVNVMMRGKWYRTNIRFQTEEEYEYFINRMCTLNKTAINIREAIKIFSDINTFPNLVLRIAVSHPFLSSTNTWSAHIRVHQRTKKTAIDLINEGFWTQEQANYILSAVERGESILIGGKSGAGKTILLNTMIEYMNPEVCAECVQETDELHSSTHPNINFLHSIEASGESKVSYSLQDMARMAVLKGSEVLIISEIKGPEAAHFFTASRTSIVYTTTHSEDFTGILPRIVELAKYGADYSQDEILKILSKTIKHVVFCEKYSVKQIAEVLGFDDKKNDVLYKLYEFES